jgi:hypothetical protein
LTGATPGLVCHKISYKDALRSGWNVVKALKALERLPIPFDL